MHLVIELCLGTSRHGDIVLHTLPVQRFTDYTVRPEGVLAYDEVEEISRRLSRFPASHEGMIGDIRWREA